MNYIPLSTFVDEIGYPRSEFVNINSWAGNNKEVLYSSDASELEDDYYIVTREHANGTEGYSLVRKKGNSFILITQQVPNHLYSSIIKNIILSKNFDDNLKYNMLLYILYYKVVYKTSNSLTDSQLSEGVVFELSNIIKLMIDREVTTYKNYDNISDTIDDVRRLLKRERIHMGIRPKLNLRR